jgi:hypothetical protein
MSPLSSHSITVQAYDAVRNKSARSVPLAVTTAPPPDSTVPTVPTILTFSDLTGTSVIVRWDASTDNVGVTGYNVYRNSVCDLDYVDGQCGGDVLQHLPQARRTASQCARSMQRETSRTVLRSA